MISKKARCCLGCWEVLCQGKSCPDWQEDFLRRWDAVNRFAWEQIDRQGRVDSGKFTYELPHMRRSPCVDCSLQGWCTRACSKRLRWWDEEMNRLRRKLGGTG